MVRLLDLPAKRIPQACIFKTTCIFLSMVAHIWIASPTQNTGLPRQDWQNWNRSSRHLTYRKKDFLFQFFQEQKVLLLACQMPAAASNLQKAQIFQPLTPSMYATCNMCGLAGPVKSKSSQFVQPSLWIWFLCYLTPRAENA